MFVSSGQGERSGRGAVQRDGAERERGTESRFGRCHSQLRPGQVWKSGDQETYRAPPPSVVEVVCH